MLITVNHVIAKRISRSLGMLLEKTNKDNKYLVKYLIFGFTFQNPLSKWIQNSSLCFLIKFKFLKTLKNPLVVMVKIYMQLLLLKKITISMLLVSKFFPQTFGGFTQKSVEAAFSPKKPSHRDIRWKSPYVCQLKRFNFNINL